MDETPVHQSRKMPYQTLPVKRGFLNEQDTRNFVAQYL